MNNTIAYHHHVHYVHVQYCHHSFYDILLRIEMSDYMVMMKKYPMTHQWMIMRRVFFWLKRLRYFIFERDVELIQEMYESTHKTYELLKNLQADEKLLNEYSEMLKKIEATMNKYGRKR